MTEDAPVRLGPVETWVFDLDNTLYPPTCDLFSLIDVRMRDFVSRFLDLPPDEAYRVQKKYFREYGTTLRGMMIRHGMEPGPFLEHVHDIELDAIPPCPGLDAVLGRLPGRKVVFTNASRKHAERVMDRLGVTRRFDGVFDIIDADYVPKPEPEVYRAMAARFGIDPRRAVMVEDIAANLIPAAEMGMTTVWLQNDTAWGGDGWSAEHVHHVARDLTEWLESALPATVQEGEALE